jgi:hypothetical protein
VEFLRFGSSIPGSYWGCCAGDIIQDFNQDPDAKSSIQIVEGDGGHPMTNEKGELLFAGPTYRDIFWQRLRFGTFSIRDMPNHFFLVALSNSQVQTAVGKKWLAILKEAGFEFIRTVNNSVWNVNNYVFGLFRGINGSAPKNAFTPPKQWAALPTVMPETYLALPDSLAISEGQKVYHKSVYDKIGQAKLLTESEIIAAGAPVIYAGKRSRYPQQSKFDREYAEKADKNISNTPVKSLKEPMVATTLSF